MTRVIERWFPCAEVSGNSASGWGSGNTERGLFTWFAARPTAQAKAAIICSLLPWPPTEIEQRRLQKLIEAAMKGRNAEWEKLRAEILKANSDDVAVLDPFSGRGTIPLEAARLGLASHAIDYSPLAVLASHLLTDYPFRDWSDEPELPYTSAGKRSLRMPHAKGDSFPPVGQRLVEDVERVLQEIGRRHKSAMRPFYAASPSSPAAGGADKVWGYLWAVTLPCRECGRRFPLVGSYELRKPSIRKATKRRPELSDPGQSFYVHTDSESGEFSAVVHEGLPKRTPTLVNAVDPNGKKIEGKAAICPFCDHPHPLEVHQRLAGEGLGRDVMLVAAEHDAHVGKRYREPTEAEREGAVAARHTLANEQRFTAFLPAVPDEEIPLNNGATIRPQLYGARTYGDLMCDRQTLFFIRLCRIISEIGDELKTKVGVSDDYTRALCGYAAAQLARLLRRSTRGANLEVAPQKVHDIYTNEGAVSFSYDFFEPSIGRGPGTWDSVSSSGLTTLRSLLSDLRGLPTHVLGGTATSLPFPDRSLTVVVTDPPYDSMVYYSDLSDILYVWLRRALHNSWPELGVTSDPRGLQDKADEIIVKEHGKAPGEHRDRTHYDTRITQAFREMRRVVSHDGLVTIVFGHGEPEVWQRLLSAISEAGLVMTGSWPANTESGGSQGKANIKTTLTMACRPATPGRHEGRKAAVEAEIRAEIHSRYPEWEKFGLAPTDMLMASAGPAMEVVGRYSQVLDHLARPIDISIFLPIARTAVREAMAVEVDHHPLDSFDARTRFALWWVRIYGRNVVAKSELRWQALADSLDLADVRDLVPNSDRGVRFLTAAAFKREVGPESSVIDVALAMAKAYPEGLDAVGEVLVLATREADDLYLWAAIKFLADRLPDSDADAIAWTAILRNRSGVGSAASRVTAGRLAERARRTQDPDQPTLF